MLIALDSRPIPVALCRPPIPRQNPFDKLGLILASAWLATQKFQARTGRLYVCGSGYRITDVAMDCSQIDLFDCADSTGGTALRRLRRLALPPGWYIFQPPLTRRRTAASMRAIWMTKCPASARPAMLAGGARLGAAITSQSFVDRGSPRRSGRLSQPRWMSGARPDRGRVEAREFGQYAGKRGPEPGYPHRRCKCTPPDPRTSTPS